MRGLPNARSSAMADTIFGSLGRSFSRHSLALFVFLLQALDRIIPHPILIHSSIHPLFTLFARFFTPHSSCLSFSELIHPAHVQIAIVTRSRFAWTKCPSMWSNPLLWPVVLAMLTAPAEWLMSTNQNLIRHHLPGKFIPIPHQNSRLCRGNSFHAQSLSAHTFP